MRTAERLPGGDGRPDVAKKKKKTCFKSEGQLNLDLVGDAVGSVAAFSLPLPC